MISEIQIENFKSIAKLSLKLGAMTVLSAIVFRELKPGDGDNVSQHGAGAGERELLPKQ